MDFSLEVTLLLSILGVLSGLVNAVAGGGGLIVLPILLWFGIPPINALATNKTQAVFGTLSSSYNYYRTGHINLKPMIPALVFAVLGSIAGTLLLQVLSSDLLAQLIPWLLIAIALYTTLSPKIGNNTESPLLSQKTFNISGGLGVGFYGGFFGPGMGAIAALSFATLLGYDLKKATAHAKPVVLVSNLVSMMIFVLAMQVFWSVAIPMALGQIIGGRIGSGLVIQRGAKLIKPAITVVTLLIAIKLIIGD